MPFAYNGNAVQTKESSKGRTYASSCELTMNNKDGSYIFCRGLLLSIWEAKEM